MATPYRGIGAARRRRRQLRLARTAVVGITFLVLVALVTSQCSGDTKHLAATTTTTRPRGRGAGITTTVPAATGQITVGTLPNRLPVKLSRSSAVSVGGRLLLVGGLGDNGSVASVLQVDPATGAAQPVGSLAVATHDAAAAALGPTVFLFGGGESVTIDTVQAFGGGRTGAVGHLPEPRSDAVAVAVAGRIYILGGYNGRVILHDVLMTADGTSFQVVAHLPVAVRYPAVAMVGTTIYLIGGQAATGPTSSIQAIDVNAGTAKVVAQLPQAIVEASGFSLGGEVYVAGGRSGSTTRSEVDRVDVASGHLTPVATLPGPVADAGTVTVGHTTYLAGGESPARLDQILTITGG